MAQTISINNFGQSNILQQTRLDLDAAASASSFTVQNNAGFVSGDYFLIGTLGGETSELRIVASVTGSTVITPTVVPAIEHDRFDYVTKLFGNKLRIYRAANVTGLQPADGDFASIATVDLQPDQAFTDYTDSDGSADYWYKFTYYNSGTNGETNLSDSKAVRGGGTGDYCSLESIRTEAGFKTAKYITDEMIDAKRQATQREIDSTLKGSYTVPFTAPINPFISDICTRLAAGLLQVEQYGQMNALSSANGQSKIDKAREDLQKLATGQLTLTDQVGNSLALPAANGTAASWPNADTADADVSDGGSPRYFRMGSLNGYQTRDF